MTGQDGNPNQQATQSNTDPQAETGPTAVTAGAETTAESKQQVIIDSGNPSEEEMKGITEQIHANFDFDVNVKPVAFNYKKSVDKETKIETIRKSVQLALPYPSVQGVVNILEAGGLQLELLMSAIEDVVNATARDLLDDTTLNASNFPVDKVSWDFISKIPKAQRRGGGIPKETWEEFKQDYIEVMPEAAGKTIEAVTAAAKLLFNKLIACKTNIEVLELLVSQLAIYTESSPNIEDYAECVDFLLTKADTLINVSPEELLKSL